MKESWNIRKGKFLKIEIQKINIQVTWWLRKKKMEKKDINRKQRKRQT